MYDKDRVNMNILVLGGDARQIYCAGRLSLEPGIITHTLYLKEDDDKCMDSVKPDVIVLPYVTLKDGRISCPLVSKSVDFEEILKYVKAGTKLFAGMLPSDKKDEIISTGGEVFDWFDDEDLTQKNAALTADGAAQIIVGKSHSAVSGSKILILGWGRVAKACAKLFRAMGAEVAVSARRSSARLDCVLNGYKSFEFIDRKAIEAADIIVNTIPCNVINVDELKAMRQECWILELASKPYGVDFSLAEDMNREVVLGAGLPGKYTPESAGRYMAESVLSKFKKGGDCSG